MCSSVRPSDGNKCYAVTLELTKVLIAGTNAFYTVASVQQNLRYDNRTGVLMHKECVCMRTSVLLPYLQRIVIYLNLLKEVHFIYTFPLEPRHGTLPYPIHASVWV